MHADSWESTKVAYLKDARGAAESISSYVSALPTIQVHPELDGRMLDIVHCFYNIARHYSRWKVAFFCTDQIENSLNRAGAD